MCLCARVFDLETDPLTSACVCVCVSVPRGAGREPGVAPRLTLCVCVWGEGQPDDESKGLLQRNCYSQCPGAQTEMRAELTCLKWRCEKGGI